MRRVHHTAFLKGRIFRAAGLLGIAVPVVALGATTTFVNAYDDIVNTTSQNLTPEGVQATVDGGYILLASTGTVNWLVKTDANGNAQWQKELGCFGTPPGDYTIGVSIRQTSDGGYILGGGSIGCGNGSSCGGLSATQCAIAEKLDAKGDLMWAKTYLTGPYGTGFTGIQQTADGGYVAAGGIYAPGPSPSSGLVLKLDASGNVQWQREIGPSGSNTVWFEAIQQTSDGGYVTTGNYYPSGSASSALVVKLDASGNIQWQEAFNLGGANSLFTDSIVQASDGGYAVAGAWFGASQKGGLLVKLDASGNIIWQNAYSGGTYFGVQQGVVIYSVHQTTDGGYFLAGDGDDKLSEGDVLVPWLAKVDSSGNPLWEHFYYEVYAPTGRPLSEYFAAADVAKDGGYVAAGWSEDYKAQLGLLYVVKTDSSGMCGSCSSVHPDEGLTAVNPGLSIAPLSLPVHTTKTPGMGSPSKTEATGIQGKKKC